MFYNYHFEGIRNVTTDPEGTFKEGGAAPECTQDVEQ